MKPKEEKDEKEPRKRITKDPAEEQQLEKKGPQIKPAKKEEGGEEDEDTIGEGLDEEEFDEFDENGGDDDFRDRLKKEESQKEKPNAKEEESIEEEERLKGIEWTDHHITNVEEEVVNKKGQ